MYYLLIICFSSECKYGIWVTVGIGDSSFNIHVTREANNTFWGNTFMQIYEVPFIVLYEGSSSN